MTAPRLVLFASLVFGSIAFAGPAAAATPTQCPQQIDLRNLMTVTEFDRAGLNKLTTQQVEALNAWLSRYLRGLCKQAPPASGATPAIPPPAVKSGTGGAQTHRPSETGGRRTATPGPSSAGVSSFGAPPERKKNRAPGRIESRIIGQFHGWTGDTVFRLENGQVWKQAGPGYFQVDLKNPKVTIKKLLIGYVLLVDGYAKEVFVRRIR